ncbi:DUF1858 domain-containing protein [Bacillus pseudomycoides]|uniref:Uncharacterized protein n=1 Tax=Bacillus pseudomycoides TaxID=64104 RepID=A0A2B6SE97_9BACI|nr:DUF1858 domain-containing protein [Bacillus pseudomycoides]PDY45623.1 hypothetical protein CON79_19670 [Bacillus pseudomycoides]PEA83541.1 hypothetical protein CON99_11280 [Bacillus pseudomycoides]PED07944.1 hypothetical protein COO19_12485 [Bacillus pseudomycoides]PED73090.1 hypothetical protein CON97_04815 [Bacillus pseudomycoides]PEI42298.1 hypothetical protein CN620_09640 [Bacillus pseudomycoides]
MTKQINFHHTVYDLTTQCPEVLPILKNLGFENITKPNMLQTVGRVMTIPKGCLMKGISLDVVKEAFQNSGFHINE